MSDPTELLSTIVEFSVGLAGFSGLVGAFMHRSGKWLYVDQFRITNLLLMSLMPGFLAFLTLGLIQISASAIELSAAAYATALALLLILIPRARAKVPARPTPGRFTHIHPHSINFWRSFSGTDSSGDICHQQQCVYHLLFLTGSDAAPCGGAVRKTYPR